MDSLTLCSESESLAVPSEIQSNRLPRISPLAAWIVFCVFCNCVGWILSALHELNTTGYAIAFGTGILALAVWKTKTKAVIFQRQDFTKLWRRFKKPFPLGFVILAGLSFVGGALYAPTNYDGLAYRTPRVLHWLAQGSWHWIHTDFNRLNTRGCAFEWMSAPMFALARTDRFEFLINMISFLLVPGTVFSIWRRLGVRGRVAWCWMWLLPTGYGYLLQAGSIANDLFGALLAMAAIEFALRARESRRLGDLTLAIFAAALMTAGKAFNLLLLLPWVVAAGPALWLLIRRPLASVLALLIAATVSLLPTAALNYRYCGDWTGQKAENLVILGSASPAFHLGVNSVLLLLDNFAPPIFPFSKSWEHLVQRVVPPALSARLNVTFEREAATLTINEMQMEEGAGIGFGLSLLLVITAIYRLKRRTGTRISCRDLMKISWLVPLSALAGTAIFMAQSGLACPARYLAPFYALLLAPLLAGGNALSQLMRRKWWQCVGLAVFLIAGVLVILSPPRPLWPAVALLKHFGADKSSAPLVKRAWTVYTVYGERGSAFEPAIAALPADANPLGVVTWDDPEASLWRPLGSRRIEHVCEADGPEYLHKRGIHYVLVSSFIVSHNYRTTMGEWLQKYHAEKVWTMTLTLRAGRGPTDWWLVRVGD